MLHVFDVSEYYQIMLYKNVALIIEELFIKCKMLQLAHEIVAYILGFSGESDLFSN